MRSTIALIATALCVLAPHAVRAAGDEKLPNLGADVERFTVSGISAGAFFAHQMHIAHSSRVSGAGLVAGGPYYCAAGNVATALSACMAHPELISESALFAATAYAEATLTIDATSNLRNDAVYIFSGTEDTVVHQGVAKALLAYYDHYLASPDQVLADFDVAAEHAMVTDDFGNPCTTLASPYINNCGLDTVGKLLNHLLGGNLTRPTPGNIDENEIDTFSQEQYVPGHPVVQSVFYSLGQSVYSYIPKYCRSNTGCKVHVAFHGCNQSLESVGEKFVRNAGYLRWAAANNIIVLFPQCQSNDSNPKACFDWWGYTGADYATKLAAQMVTVISMVDDLGKSP